MGYSMVIELSQIFDIVGERRTVDFEIEPEILAEVKGFRFSSPVSVKGEIFNRTGIVCLEYTVEFKLKGECDRCLAEYEAEYRFRSLHVVVKEANTDNDEYIIAEGSSINLSQIAVSELILQCPTKMLCSEDCKGLCMHCGHDLNESECGCYSDEQ